MAILPKEKGTKCKTKCKSERLTFNQRRSTEVKEPIILQQTNTVGTKRGKTPESRTKFDRRRMWRDNF